MIKTEKEKKVFINNFNLNLKRKSLRDTFKENKINTKYSISEKTIVYFFYKHSIS